MAEHFGEAMAALILLIGALAGLAGAGAQWLRSRAKVADAVAGRERAHADRERLQAELVELQAHRARCSLPPPEPVPWLDAVIGPLQAAMARLEQRLEKFGSKLEALDEKHDGTRDRLSKLEGKMNGKH